MTPVSGVPAPTLRTRALLPARVILGYAAAVLAVAAAGLAGLANAPGQGRPAILGTDDADRVKAAVKANRQQLKDVTASLHQELNKDFSPRTLKRFLKSMGPNGGASATA